LNCLTGFFGLAFSAVKTGLKKQIFIDKARLFENIGLPRSTDGVLNGRSRAAILGRAINFFAEMSE
jgi:hypothetical protein